MRPDPWQRWSPLAGVVFAVLFLAALGVSWDDPGDTPAEVAEYYADDENRAAQFVVFFLLAAAALGFLWFLGALRGLLVRAEGAPGRWTALGFGAGVASATLLLAAGSAFVAPAAGASRDEFDFDPATANMLLSAGGALLATATMAAALLVLTTSIVAYRTRLLPRWLALAGFVVAPALLFAVLLWVVFAWIAWVLAVSVALIVRTARVADWRSGISAEG